MKGRDIETIIKTGASHALYRKVGDWYHHLRRFPGTLFDENGYVHFESEEKYRNSPLLQHGQDLHVRNGITSIPSYTLYTSEQKKALKSLF